MSELSARFEAEFVQDMRALGVLPPSSLLRVTDHMHHIVDFIAQLQRLGFACARCAPPPAPTRRHPAAHRAAHPAHPRGARPARPPRVSAPSAAPASVPRGQELWSTWDLENQESAFGVGLWTCFFAACS